MPVTNLTARAGQVHRLRLVEIIPGRTLAVFAEVPYEASPTFIGFTAPAVIRTLLWLWIYQVVTGPDCPRCGEASAEHRTVGSFVVCPDGFLDESPEPYPAVDATDDGCPHGD